MTSLELQRIVDAARQLGEREVIQRLADGTIVEIHFHPEGEAPPEPTSYTADSLERFIRHQSHQNPHLN